MTIGSDIRALDGPQLGRAPLISQSEAGTLTNAIRTIRGLGRVPLVDSLEALRARLTGEQTPKHIVPLTMRWEDPTAEPETIHVQFDGPPVIHETPRPAHLCYEAMDEPDPIIELPEVLSDEMTETHMQIAEDLALIECRLANISISLTC